MGGAGKGEMARLWGVGGFGAMRPFFVGMPVVQLWSADGYRSMSEGLTLPVMRKYRLSEQRMGAVLGWTRCNSANNRGDRCSYY